MIKVTALYPFGEGKRFDIDYYRNSHIPMVKRAMGTACRGISVDVGVAGRTPGSPPPFFAMAHMLFDSMESFRAAFGPVGAELSGDAANYTDISPLMQISEADS